MMTVFVKLRAKPGCEGALCDGAQMLVTATREEPGALEYGAFRSQQDPAVLWFFEVWRDKDANQAHVQTPHLREFFELSKGLLAGRPEIDEVKSV